MKTQHTIIPTIKLFAIALIIHFPQGNLCAQSTATQTSPVNEAIETMSRNVYGPNQVRSAGIKGRDRADQFVRSCRAKHGVETSGARIVNNFKDLNTQETHTYDELQLVYERGGGRWVFSPGWNRTVPMAKWYS